MNRSARSRSRRTASIVLAGLCSLALAGCGTVEQRPAALAPGDAIRLSPSPAFANARLAVIFGDTAPDPSRCRFEWRRNGMRIDGATTSELEPARFRRGDNIVVRVVTPAEGPESRAWTAQTQVVNSPPQVTRVAILMGDAPGSADLRAVVECADPDGDSPRLEYEWFRNGNAIENATGPGLSAASLERGDRVTVQVVARDFESESPPAQSEPFALENHPPVFSSQPSVPGPGDATFAYRAVATDPDGDALRYELVSGPDGLTVSPQGQVLWSLPAGPARRGEYVVRIRATDSNGGEAVQEFTLRLGQAVAVR